jgi:hypothetical protein
MKVRDSLLLLYRGDINEVACQGTILGKQRKGSKLIHTLK